MIININDKWRIETDKLNWIVQKRVPSKKTGVAFGPWINQAYCGSLPMALEMVLTRQARELGGGYPAEALGPLCGALADIKRDVWTVLENVERGDPPKWMGKEL